MLAKSKTLNSRLARNIENGSFILTAEYLPHAVTDCAGIADVFDSVSDSITAVNVAANPHGAVLSSLAASVAVSRAGIEPVYHLVTRDRNRIALQSDLLGAAALGISNVLCLSGYHQALTRSPESANVYDIDSIQLVDTVRRMNEEGTLLDGTAIEGDFDMLAGAAANPFLTPLELNMIRLVKKVDAGARFIQTQAIFDIEEFHRWLEAAHDEGITERTVILAGVLPLESASEAEMLRDTYTGLHIPDKVIERLKEAGSSDAQKREGIIICTEIIKRIKDTDNLRGIHIFSGGREHVVPELLSIAGLCPEQ